MEQTEQTKAQEHDRIELVHSIIEQTTKFVDSIADAVSMAAHEERPISQGQAEEIAEQINLIRGGMLVMLTELKRHHVALLEAAMALQASAHLCEMHGLTIEAVQLTTNDDKGNTETRQLDIKTVLTRANKTLCISDDVDIEARPTGKAESA